MKIYMDVCCLNRPLDDQSQERIRIESEAVLLVLQLCGQAVHRWVSSDVVDEEVRQNPDEEHRLAVQAMLSSVDERLLLNDAVKTLARTYTVQGIAAMDGLHLATAELGGCDVLLTTDDNFLKRARRVQPSLRVRVENPARWILEVLQDGA